MSIVGKIKLKERLEIKHIRNGKVIEERVIEDILEDIITNVGKAQVAGLINGVVTTPFKYIAIGTGTTAESATDTALVSEIARGLATCSRTTTNVTNDTAQLVYTFTFTASYAITESGVFDASTEGNMLCRKTFSAINVSSGDSLQVTWKIVVS
jgi:hypothetical protein